MRFGNDPTVVINGTKAVKEAMLNDDLLGRPKSTVGDENLDPFFTKKCEFGISCVPLDQWAKFRLLVMLGTVVNNSSNGFSHQLEKKYAFMNSGILPRDVTT